MKASVYIIKPPPFWTKTTPLSLIYLKKHLDKYGFKPKIKDLNIELFHHLNISRNQWLSLDDTFDKNLSTLVEGNTPNYLKKFLEGLRDIDFIGLSLFKRNTPFALFLADKIRKYYPDKKIIFGGPQTLFIDRKKGLTDNDYWVIGEGEIPLYKILCGGKTKVYRFQEMEDLDSLPLYDFEDLPAGRYANTLPLLSSRGCPHKCSFCTERLLFNSFRHHSPEYMVDQISFLQNKYNSNTFVFCDSLLNYSRKWLEDFCLLVINKKMNIKWEAQMRIDKDLPLSLARLIKKSGCYNLFIGLESGSDNVLKLMNKGFCSSSALKFFDTLSKAGLHFEVSLIFGYPGETNKDFYETLSLIKLNKNIIPKIAQVNPFVDYLNIYKEQSFPNAEGLSRVKGFLEVLKNDDIKYTKSFIANLVYK